MEKDELLEVLKEVIDPELNVNIVDLGLVYDVALEDGKVDVTMTLTTPGCPLHDSISSGVRNALQQYPEVKDVEVNIVWEPAWTPEMMTKKAKEYLWGPI